MCIVINSAKICLHLNFGKIKLMFNSFKKNSAEFQTNFTNLEGD
jgi:hypothetical protein